MRQINLTDFTIPKIRKGALDRFIPELYDLRGVIENNPWHDKESVFDHTFAVFGSLQKIVRNSNRKIKQALEEVIDRNSRKKLLYIAALIHDIGKGDTITDLGNGARGCPGHEKKGATISKNILKRFNLSQGESKIVIDIVGNHGIIHDTVGLGYKRFKKGAGKDHSLTHAVADLEKKNFKKEYINLKKKLSNIYMELILLAFADTVVSYLKKTDPAEYRHRINFYKKELKSLSVNN